MSDKRVNFNWKIALKLLTHSRNKNFEYLNSNFSFRGFGGARILNWGWSWCPQFIAHDAFVRRNHRAIAMMLGRRFVRLSVRVGRTCIVIIRRIQRRFKFMIG